MQTLANQSKLAVFVVPRLGLGFTGFKGLGQVAGFSVDGIKVQSSFLVFWCPNHSASCEDINRDFWEYGGVTEVQ